MQPLLTRLILLLAMTAIVPPGIAQTGPVPLTLDDATRIFLERNLDIEAARLQVERARADQIAARLRPNPGITVTAENFRFSGDTPFNRLYEVSASYAETIELGGKRRLRGSVADLSVSVAEAQLADTLRRGVFEVKRLYYAALLARENVVITTENGETFEQLVQYNLARFEEGAISEGDLIKVRLEYIKFDNAVRQAELALRQATIQLIERIGESSYDAHAIVGNLDFRPVVLELGSLKEAALQERPDVRAAELQIALAEQRVALENALGVPNITPFVGYKRAASSNTVLFGVSIPLNFRDRNQAGIARAITDHKIVQAQLGAVRNRALAEVESAYRAYESKLDQILTFRNQLLLQADESIAISLVAYQEGVTALLPLLDAQRTRTEIRQQYFQTLFDYNTSVLELELAVGGDIQP